jgi:hypothetical protein
MGVAGVMGVVGVDGVDARPRLGSNDDATPAALPAGVTMGEMTGRIGDSVAVANAEACEASPRVADVCSHSIGLEVFERGESKAGCDSGGVSGAERLRLSRGLLAVVGDTDRRSTFRLWPLRPRPRLPRRSRAGDGWCWLVRG